VSDISYMNYVRYYVCIPWLSCGVAGVFTFCVLL
jgi:hypothetical protein